MTQFGFFGTGLELSDAVSVLSNKVSVLSNAVSVLSQAQSVLSQQVSVLSQQVSTISQQVSVLSQQVSVQSQQISVLSQQVSALSARILYPGQCRLSVKSTTSVTMQPYGGQYLWINGAPQKIPSGGVEMGTGGLTSATTYNLYAFMSATTMTLEATTSAHATDTVAPNIGVEIKSGDATRTLVGMVRLNASVQFVNSATQRFLLSYFNRRLLAMLNNYTADRTTGSATYVELNAEIQNTFLTWGDEAVVLAVDGGSNSGGTNTTAAIGVDSTTVAQAGFESGVINSGTNPVPLALAGVVSLAEGYHYATLLGATSGGTLTYWATTALFTKVQASLHVWVRG